MGQPDWSAYREKLNPIINAGHETSGRTTPARFDWPYVLLEGKINRLFVLSCGIISERNAKMEELILGEK
jgi:hypothetical protein